MKVCLLPCTKEFVSNEHFNAFREWGRQNPSQTQLLQSYLCMNPDSPFHVPVVTAKITASIASFCQGFTSFFSQNKQKPTPKKKKCGKGTCSLKIQAELLISSCNFNSWHWRTRFSYFLGTCSNLDRKRQWVFSWTGLRIGNARISKLWTAAINKCPVQKLWVINLAIFVNISFLIISFFPPL